jgi:hypothetical protein
MGFLFLPFYYNFKPLANKNPYFKLTLSVLRECIPLEWLVSDLELRKGSKLPYDPAIPLLGIYPKDCDTGYSRGTCTPMFIAALFTIVKLWKQPRCPTTDEWIKKM